MPSTSGSDNPMVQHAGHRNFEKLLRCGVRLIEYPSALLHQKIMTIDGGGVPWARPTLTTGPSRPTTRSWSRSWMPQPRGASTQIFERYAADGSDIELARWSRRSVAHKFVDHMYYLINELF